METTTTPDRLEFRGGMYVAFVAPVIFLAGVTSYFIAFNVFDMTALTASGLVGLLLGALLARKYSSYWDAALRGLSSPTASTLLMILLAVSLFSMLLNASGAANGLIWAAQEAGVSPSFFPAIAFAIAGVMSMSTGTSIGTLFTAFPVIFPAGTALGAHPLLLAGAILSGALFGDNLAPISDSTVVSSATQRFRRKEGVADIAGVVRSRARYSLTTAAIALVLYIVVGLVLTSDSGSITTPTDVGPKPLIMLVAVVALLGVAFWKRDLFLATTVGLVVGTVIGLVFGLITPADIISAKDDAAAGFLVDGITDVLPLIGLGIIVFAIIGVLEGSGVFDAIVEAVTSSRFTTTARGTEATIAVGAIVSGGLFAGVNGPTMMFYGPLVDRIGSRVGLHPYRRANVMDCNVLGLGSVVPVVSSFLLIASMLTEGPDEVSALALFAVTFYPLVLSVAMAFSILTGWGRRFEGADGAPVREPVEIVDRDVDTASAQTADSTPTASTVGANS
ncbi:Na+/H+ antiporter NhaC family protein [Gordonia hankookensis]|uniref:Na+/H+ antiporter NhaC family protein n=1 Tax=Gordonia hankookensis TaxID=589403 RepID=A0ABR7WCN5_9ACTN|nr:Na+/H+ antiporter NhaC family protein [Gordonia hankookensis]MBD1320556.1 Na+/H+ antiporter NhaC family protein [Gordonia hankookensis]